MRATVPTTAGEAAAAGPPLRRAVSPPVPARSPISLGLLC